MLIPVPDKAVMVQKVVTSLSRIHELGEDLRTQYVSQTIDSVTLLPESNNIRRNQILTFSNRSDLTKKETKRVVYRKQIRI